MVALHHHKLMKGRRLGQALVLDVLQILAPKSLSSPSAHLWFPSVLQQVGVEPVLHHLGDHLLSEHLVLLGRRLLLLLLAALRST